MRQVRTRGGVFGSGGYGSGLFDGSNSGFGGVGGLGATYEQAAAGLGAATSVPWQVARWFSSNVKDWPLMPAEQQQQLLSAAKAKEAAYQGYLQSFRNQGACDGTKPGLMAGALKEKLIAAGADKAKLDADDSVFGPAECSEWSRIFGASPTAADAAAAWQYGGNTFGGVQITYKDVCPSPKLPVCPSAAPPPPPPPPPVTPVTPPVLPPTKKKSGVSTAWILGGLLAAGLVTGVAVAASKKKH